MVLKTAERNEDSRGKKIVFVTSCLLNANNKVQGLARYSGMCKEVVDALDQYGIGVNQMLCPETLCLGVQRWWATKNLYAAVGFRRHCRALAEQMVDYMECYEQVGYEVLAVLASNGSPTCGVDLTSYSEEWGGCPTAVVNAEALVPGRGVYMEELEQAILARGLKMPIFYGLTLDDETLDLEVILADFRKFIADLCE